MIILRCGKALALAALLILLSVFPVPTRADENPLEQFNKAMHDFNQKYYESSGAEANQFMSETVPEGFRRGVSNFFANMGEPVVAVSSLAQGDINNAEIATKRFFYNLIYGYGGVVDRATEEGVKAEPRDMGQAICSIGLPDGPFVVLPFYGPSTVGDFVGSVLPIVAGYVALGEVFWVYRASSRVALTMSDKEEAGKTASYKDDEGAYQSDKARYLAARAAACHKHLLEHRPVTTGAVPGEVPQLAADPR